MKRIILSIAVIAVAAVATFAGTQAFFSDTETSQGNVFAAGAIDLRIDNESYVTDESGDLVKSDRTSWDLADLNGDQGPADGRYLFFDFADLKPGDIGEDTISIHVDNNDAWACMAANITDTPENGQTEPEADVDPTAGVSDGELQDELQFAFWADDGDNVYEDDEHIFREGTAGALFDGSAWTLADADNNVWGDPAGTPLAGGDGDEPVYYIAKAWCHGDLTENPVDQDSGDDSDRNPINAGTGFTCDGASVTNASQTDGVVMDVQFYAVQSRNNDGFVCSEDFRPNWNEQEEGGSEPQVFSTDVGYDPNADGDNGVDLSSANGYDDTLSLTISEGSLVYDIHLPFTPGTDDSFALLFDKDDDGVADFQMLRDVNAGVWYYQEVTGGNWSSNQSPPGSFSTSISGQDATITIPSNEVNSTYRVALWAGDNGSPYGNSSTHTYMNIPDDTQDIFNSENDSSWTSSANYMTVSQ